VAGSFLLDGEAERGMQTGGRIFELQSRLCDMPELARRGIGAEQLALNEIALSHSGHVIGVWRFAKGRFLFIPAGYGEALFATESVEDAMRFTLEHLDAPALN
jgi:hypothetical protein